MKTFVIGDIHGAYKALRQCFERSGFDYEKDKLIFVGDVTDGWSETYECVEELMKVKNLVFVLGNHDVWLMDWLEFGSRPAIWTTQGGEATLKSYLKEKPSDWQRHLKFLRRGCYYYVDEQNRCFVHGGVSRKGVPIKDTDPDFLMWDRDLWEYRPVVVPEFSEVYVGHTSIWRFSHRPIKYGNVIFMDTGAGWEGVLSMIDLESGELFQSDKSRHLYLGAKGRN